mmetsp:Transcript_55658/g.132694  ORF Transcript_55658/g.132694 Transcript_55658/m.132694 type:complete len:456 (-) Transcript_55658:134-1501(-)
MPSLDIFDVNSYLQVLSYLDACTLGRMACGSRLLSVASEEAQRRPALLVLKGTPEEVLQEMKSKLASRPTLAFVNYTEKRGDMDRGEDILAFMTRVLPPTTTVLAGQTNSLFCIPSSSGTLEDARSYEEIGVLLATLPEAVSKSFYFEQTPRLPGERPGRAPPSDSEDDDDDDDDDEEELPAPASEVAAPAALPKTPENCPDKEWLLSLGAGSSGAAAGPLGAPPPSVEEPKVAVRTADLDCEELFNLDPPPRVIVIHIAGCGESLIRRLQERYPDAAIIGGVAMGQEVVVRDVAKDGRQRSAFGRGVGIMAICGNAPVFAMTSPMIGNEKVAQAHLRSSLQTAVKHAATEERRILGALLFSCNARQMFSADKSDPVQFLEQVPKAQLLGCYAGGEIGPEARPDCTFVSGRARLQGFTAVFGVFLVPKLQAPSVHFQRAVLQGEVTEAFAALRQR